MGILVTGIRGFEGVTLARKLREGRPDLPIVGLGNLGRTGREINRAGVSKMGVTMMHGDIRNSSDLEFLPRCDRVLDAAGNPGVLARLNGKTRSGLTKAAWFQQLSAWSNPRWLGATLDS